jgi:hypothetical protein
MLNVANKPFMLSVIMLNVVMVSVVAPNCCLGVHLIRRPFRLVISGWYYKFFTEVFKYLILYHCKLLCCFVIAKHFHPSLEPTSNLASKY